MTCRNICWMYKKTLPAGRAVYANGRKYCSRCARFMEWDGKYCPCCGVQMRVRRRCKPLKVRLGR